MDERFKNIRHRRNYTLGLVLLCILSLLMIIANRFVYTLLTPRETWIGQLLGLGSVAIIMAEFALLAIWTVMADTSLKNRALFLIVSSTVLLAAWLLGFISTFSTEVGLNLRNREVLYYLGYIPIIFLAVGLPLIILRFFTGSVLAPIDGELPARRPVTTLGLMMTTAVVAFVLSAIQLPTLIGNRQSDIWAVGGGFSGAAFLVGLLIVLPAVILLFSSKRNFPFWSIALLIWSTALATGLLCLVSWIRNGRFRDVQELLQPAFFVAFAVFMLSIGIFTIRLLGYRLKRARRA